MNARGIESVGGAIIALCDVDWKRAEGAVVRWPNLPRYNDFRQMLEKEKNVDAVVVSTPDHFHAVAAIAALQMGKHVRVEKPLAHSIYDVRKLTEAAKYYSKLTTQMGNQGHSNEGVRLLCELIWSGAIGQVREVHGWSDRPGLTFPPGWPQNVYRPVGSDPVPRTLDWDRWLGPAPTRPYVAKSPGTDVDCYCPYNWRGWRDFGSGAMGDMACHVLDPANWALHLTAPTLVTPLAVDGGNYETYPKSERVRFDFPERPGPDGALLPAVKVFWHDGEYPLPLPEDCGLSREKVAGTDQLNGGAHSALFIGEKGYIACGPYGENPTLYPRSRWEGFKPPDPWIPRTPISNREWLDAIVDNRQPCGAFSYGGPFTEWVLVGNLAVRAGIPIQWNAQKMEVTGQPSLNAWIRPRYRKGWPEL